jgi:hypothetical protein
MPKIEGEIMAWRHLHDNGLLGTLPGRYGRAAQAIFIEREEMRAHGHAHDHYLYRHAVTGGLKRLE